MPATPDPLGLPIEYMKSCKVFEPLSTSTLGLCCFYQVGQSGEFAVSRATPARGREATTQPLPQSSQAGETEPAHCTSPGLGHCQGFAQRAAQPHKLFTAEKGHGQGGEQEQQIGAEAFLFPLLPVLSE